VEERIERGSAGYSRPPLARMLRLHEWLMENRYPIAERWRRNSRYRPRPSQRDVNFMRDQMGLPIGV